MIAIASDVMPTVGEAADGEDVSVLGDEGKRNIRSAFTDQDVRGQQTLEDYGPCRVSQSVLQSAEDLGDTGFAGMGCDQEVLDVFGLGRSILRAAMLARLSLWII